MAFQPKDTDGGHKPHVHDWAGEDAGAGQVRWTCRGCPDEHVLEAGQSPPA